MYPPPRLRDGVHAGVPRQTPNTLAPVPVKHQTPWHLAPGTWHLAPGTLPLYL